MSLPDGPIIFSGVKRKKPAALPARFGGQPRIVTDWESQLKAELAVSTFYFLIDYYKGKFDTDKLKQWIKRQKMPLQEVSGDKENRLAEIYLQEPVSQAAALN